MDINYLLFIILLFTEMGLLFTVNSKGMIYDKAKERFDKRYTGNHSFRFKNGKFRFSIPFFIEDKTPEQSLKKAIYQYNTYSCIFWINGVILFILTQIK